VYVFSYEPFVGSIGCAINGQTLEQTSGRTPIPKRFNYNGWNRDSIRSGYNTLCAKIILNDREEI